MTKANHPTFWPSLLAVRDEIPGARTFRFSSPKGFSFVPGQFLMFHFADDPKTWRAYSLCSSPVCAGEFFEVTVGMVGPFSERLGALQPRREGGLVVRGPFGRWTYDGSVPHAVLISSGTGVTPFRAMCLLKTEMGLAGKITLVCSARTPSRLLYRGEHEAWSRAGIAVHPLITRRGERITPEIALEAAADPAATYFLCGPNKMVQELRAGLQAKGVPAENVRVEKWGDYADLF
ncbi:MAG: FAD-dependent oxidoreductase [Elusimicrobia bacterium]|nr:FAD-dependent oxidoreductase [Elusimicrobiota bacterium]